MYNMEEKLPNNQKDNRRWKTNKNNEVNGYEERAKALVGSANRTDRR